MAVHVGSGQNLTRTTGTLLSFNASSTWMAWVKFQGWGASWPILFSMDASAWPGGRSVYIYLFASIQYIYLGESSSTVAGSLSLDTWYHVALVCSWSSPNLTCSLYVRNLAGSTVASITGLSADTSAWDTIDGMGIGTNQYGGEYPDADIAYTKIFSAALTTTEQIQEMYAARPVRGTNVWGFYPHFPGSGTERARDYSGNARSWTDNSSSDADAPPVSWGSAVFIGTGFLDENLPVWVSPENETTIGDTPTLVLTTATFTGNIHLHLQLDTADSFDTGNLREIKTNASTTGWEYWDGDSWEPFPSTGMPDTYSGNDVRYTVQSALSEGTWYRRVRQG